MTVAAAAPPEGVDAVIAGEIHDNPDHHLYQAQIVRDLDPAAVVFEMLTPQQAAAIDGMDRGDEAALRAALDWDSSGWPEFSIYYPIFAASDAPIYGAAVVMDDIRLAMAEDAATAFGAGAETYGLTPLPDEQIALLATEMQDAHCGMLPPEMLPAMVEAQRMRDAHFARVTATALLETGGPVVVITGNGHARNDRGMTWALGQADPTLKIWSIGQLEGAATAADLVYDETRVTPIIQRDDPCLALGGQG